MTPDRIQEKIQDLEAQIQVLQAENFALAERSEDVLLIGLIAENFSVIHTREDVIDRLLERLCILKKIPFSACCQVQGTTVEIQKYYSMDRVNVPPGTKCTLDPSVFLDMASSSLILPADEIGNRIRDWPEVFNEMHPTSILLHPFQARSIPNGLLLLLGDESLQDQSSTLTLLMQRLAEIMVSKLDNITMFQELNQLTEELDHRVEQRTRELRKINAALEKEISKRQATEEQLREERSILRLLNEAQSRYFIHEDHTTILKALLSDVMELVESEIGFLTERDFTVQDDLQFHRYVISATSDLQMDYSLERMRAYAPDSLLGICVREQKPVISNDLPNDSRCQGLPVKHPPIQTFMALPVVVENEIVGLIGLANRPDGYSQQQVERLQPFLTVLGNFIHVFHLSEQREKMAQSLEAERTKLAEIFDSAPEAIVLTDANHTIHQVNREFTHLFGYPSAEVHGKTIEEIWGPWPEPEKQAIEEALGADERLRLETARTGRDGKELFVSMIVGRIRFRDGLENYLYIMRDITEQRLIQTTLHEIAEGSLATEGEPFLLNTVLFLTRLLQVDFAFVADVNHGEEGRVATLAVSHHNQIVENLSCPLEGNPCGQVLEEGKASYLSNVRRLFSGFDVLVKNKIECYLAVRLDDSQQHPLGVLGVMHTRTVENPQLIESILSILRVRVAVELERRIRQQEKEEIESAMRQAQKLESMGRIAGGVAHDFNNILAGMMGYAEYLDSVIPASSDKERKAIEAILRGAERAGSLTKQLLGFARKTQFSPQPAAVPDLIEESLKVSEKIFEKKIHISLNLADDLWNVVVDRNQIDQVFTNLFINARDAMPNGGSLRIEAQNVVLDQLYLKEIRNLSPGKYVKISVSDTGVGIPEDVLDHIFEPFFTTKGEGEGTGLGLSVVYGIVRAHQGQITCYSVPGEGTTFNLYLPASEEEAKTETRITQPEKGTETILVVEDEEDIRDVIKMQLEALGYQVKLAENGVKAVEIYEKHPYQFDLVIFDLVMPGMNGIETYHRLVKINPEVRCILMSGYSKDTQASDLFQSGKVGFLQKPFRLHELTQAIQKSMSQS
ncbi:MAG: response regulator [Candidatus Neomarinimicrobiota bacterium]|nr:MAG: response regulator [Candidatus Neomarinimicrobiota bacterium]